MHCFTSSLLKALVLYQRTKYKVPGIDEYISATFFRSIWLQQGSLFSHVSHRTKALCCDGCYYDSPVLRIHMTGQLSLFYSDSCTSYSTCLFVIHLSISEDVRFQGPALSLEQMLTASGHLVFRKIITSSV